MPRADSLRYACSVYNSYILILIGLLLIVALKALYLA